MTIAIEPPYKMSEPPQPASKDAYVIDWRDRFRWNKGGVGRIPGALPKPSGHPDPRVIVNVSAVRGPHDAKALQRVARKHHWMAAVRCYRLGAYKDPHLRGWTYATIEVSAAGKVTKTQLRSSELKSAEVAECLAAKLADLALPQAASASEVEVDIRMGPGDEPLPPPDELIVPGDGELTADAMTAGVRAGLPAFEACYRAALASAPELWGRLLIRFHVTASGKLDEAFETVSQFPDLRTKLCVLRAARKLRFRRPSGGGIRFEVPLLFFTDRASLPAGPRAETYPR